eukprot:6201918-Pleurochrysis_carterae.AAC.2
MMIEFRGNVGSNSKQRHFIKRESEKFTNINDQYMMSNNANPKLISKQQWPSTRRKTRKRSLQLVKCRFRRQHVSGLARQSSENGRASSFSLLRFHADNLCIA